MRATAGTGLLERERALDEIRERLESSRAGAGSTMVVECPGGIGKTELLLAAGREARERDMGVLSARGAELERELGGSRLARFPHLSGAPRRGPPGGEPASRGAPTVFAAVPRVWQKTKASFDAALVAEQDAARRSAAERAIDIGRRAAELEQRGEPLPKQLRAERERADELGLSGIRRRLGLDRCEVAVCAPAPVPPEVLRFFHAIGLPVLGVYGLSETSAGTTADPPDRPRIGTVGPPVPAARSWLPR